MPYIQNFVFVTLKGHGALALYDTLCWHIYYFGKLSRLLVGPGHRLLKFLCIWKTDHCSFFWQEIAKRLPRPPSSWSGRTLKLNQLCSSCGSPLFVWNIELVYIVIYIYKIKTSLLFAPVLSQQSFQLSFKTRKLSQMARIQRLKWAMP